MQRVRFFTVFLGATAVLLGSAAAQGRNWVDELHDKFTPARTAHIAAELKTEEADGENDVLAQLPVRLKRSVRYPGRDLLQIMAVARDSNAIAELFWIEIHDPIDTSVDYTLGEKPFQVVAYVENVDEEFIGDGKVDFYNRIKLPGECRIAEWTTKTTTMHCSFVWPDLGYKGEFFQVSIFQGLAGSRLKG